MARDDPDVGAIILCGEGPDAFCSGGDQKIRGDDGYIGDDAVAQRGIGRLNVLDLQVLIRRLPKPIVGHDRRATPSVVATSSTWFVTCPSRPTMRGSVRRGRRSGASTGGFGSSILARTIGSETGQRSVVLVPAVRRATGPRVGTGERRRPPRRARARDGRVVSPDADLVAHRAAHDQGGHERSRRRPGGRPTARGGCDHALLHDRRGTRRTKRLRRAPTT